VKIGLLYYQYLMSVESKNSIEANKFLEKIHLLDPNFLDQSQTSSKN